MQSFLKSISALNDQTRVLLLAFLLKNGKSCVCEFESSFDMIQSRLSRHLKILKEAGFINVERKGTWAYYYIEPETDFQNSSLKQIESLNLDIPKKVCKRGVVKNPIAKARGLEIRKSILISEDA